MGPLKDLMSTLLDKFVYIRLSVLLIDGTSEAAQFHFSAEDWQNEMFLAGKISGRFDIISRPLVFQ